MEEKKHVVVRIADELGYNAQELFNEVRDACFKGKQVADSRVFAFLAQCEKTGLDPLSGEIAYMEQGGTWRAVIMSDGWARIASRHPDCAGYNTECIWENGKLVGARCTLHRHRWTHPLIHYEYMEFCQRNTPPWKQNPARMIQHKARNQAIRNAFGIGRVCDLDEWENIAENVEPEKKQTEKSREEKVINPSGQFKSDIFLAIEAAQSVSDLDKIYHAVEAEKETVPQDDYHAIAQRWMEKKVMLDNGGSIEHGQI
ncbi:recombinase RecT [Ferrimonas balearica]|uniref:recombinase RecT n=1 Tax=Ferrimonas balearica TaxID=44012 RepID=UPI001F30650D|nr:recombinase RecT [Ferrimonas balearica]MBY6093805.1 recombinase RecT [Ferrimonas balearica]